ncbi:MAG: phage portal protein [Dyadobacter sp.]|uniref:phage portal protein n=1 Tax=Dyadobacter sp. TaxID=1914288 RepID=UPI001B099FD4|nr:phage portal protein [Dyadobacter sp.]MBO9611055.1 phage portal protein [Dyadobacter sp.]
MGVFDVFKQKQDSIRVTSSVSANRPMEMLLKWQPNGQVIMYNTNGEELLDKGFLSNHAIFTIQDWKCQKVAMAPFILYEVRDKKLYKQMRNLLKFATPEAMDTVRVLHKSALVEVDRPEITRIFDRPNPMMPWAEFAYGTVLYKDQIGAGHWMGVRAGSANDPTTGKIREIYLPPAHHMVAESGGMTQPVGKWFLKTNPEVKIDAANVYSLRNFSPIYTTETQFLYGLSRLHALRAILQKHNEGTKTEAEIYAQKGIRDIVFPQALPEHAVIDYDTFQQTRDAWNQKVNEAKQGNILINDVPLGSLRIGFSPQDLGLLESQSVTKKDFCAAYHVKPEIFGWSDQSTFNNVAEARKSSFTDAVVPELEAMVDALNTWYLPSYDDSGKLAIAVNYDHFAELQEDSAEKAKWLDLVPLSANEFREAMGWGEGNGENDNKTLVNSGKKILDDLGLESFRGNPDASYDEDLNNNNG